MWMPRNRAGRGRQRVGGGGKGGRTVGGVRGAGNGGSKTAPPNRSIPLHPIGPLDPAPSSGATALAFLISEFRIPYGVWGKSEGSDMACPMGGRPGRGGRRAKGGSEKRGAKGNGRRAKGDCGPLDNKKPLGVT
jgi:hypothetical protein